MIEKLKILLPTKDATTGKQNKKTMGRGVISFEKGKAGDQDIILFVFRDPIGRTLYTGRLEKT